MQNVAFDLGYLARLHCASHEMNGDVTWSLLVLFPSFSSRIPPPLWGPSQTRLEWSPDFSEGWTTFYAVWLDSKRLSACVSYSAAALCVWRIWQQNCHLLFCTCLCLWESSYSLLVVVQQWACVCVCLWMQGYGNSKFTFFLTSSPGFLDLLFAAESRVLSQSRSVDDVRQCSLPLRSDFTDSFRWWGDKIFFSNENFFAVIFSHWSKLSKRTLSFQDASDGGLVLGLFRSSNGEWKLASCTLSVSQISKSIKLCVVTISPWKLPAVCYVRV